MAVSLRGSGILAMATGAAILAVAAPVAAQDDTRSSRPTDPALSSQACIDRVKADREANAIIRSGVCGTADSTPFVTITRKQTAGSVGHKFCYYRLDVTPIIPAGHAQIGHLKRKAVKRYLVGANYSFTSILKVKVGIYEESVVLYSRKYLSSRDEGENHDRISLRRGSDYPVFLLRQDANGEAGLAVSADMQNVQSFSVAGSALEAVSVALKAIAPTSDIVTTLTSSSARSVAQKIDAGAGAFSSSTGNNLERWDLNILRGEKVEIEVFGPEFEINPNDASYILGKWDVGFVSPFASYFYQDVNCGTEAESEAWSKRGSNVGLLSTQLVSNVSEIGTMASYLRQREWWSRLIGQMTSTSGALDPTLASAFCRAIVDSVSDLGFNTVDSYLVADAVGRSSLVSPQIGAAMLQSRACDFTKRRDLLSV